ncbi:MAG: peptidyl-prolyl cis-trans isomerase [Candidatus Eisenbacteria bacterium]|nr:peptidyl-prolyl cis-trans isomerase [Candidatus Eisenbacteria bacterium]
MYQHYVIDSVRVEEPEIRAFYETQKYTQHFRQILFADRATAAKVRDQITARKLTWDAAFARYDIGGGKSDLGWVEQSALSPDVALLAYPLAAGAISQPIPDRQHWRLFQSVERRPQSDAPEYHAVRTMLRMTILSLRTSERAEAIQAILRARIGMAYDTTAVRWVSTHFGSKSNLSMNMGHQGSPEMSVVDTVPAFAPEDTSRVLATWKDGGRLTLSTVLHAYTDITPVSRPPMSTPEAVQAQIDALVLEPYMAQYAVEKGLDQDPFVQRMIAQKREELLVKHMYGDSVESRVWVSKADRQKYYKDRPADFTTYPRSRSRRSPRPPSRERTRSRRGYGAVSPRARSSSPTRWPAFTAARSRCEPRRSTARITSSCSRSCAPGRSRSRARTATVTT